LEATKIQYNVLPKR